MIIKGKMKDKVYECEYCSATFTTNRSKNRHINGNKCKNGECVTLKVTKDEMVKMEALLKQMKEIEKVGIINTVNNNNITNAVNHINNNIDNNTIINDNSINNNNNNNNNITINIINVLEKVDIMGVLTKEMGKRQALEYIKSVLYRKIDGEMDCFKKFYLPEGNPEEWRIRCIDKTRLNFEIIGENGEVINDIGGIKISNAFRENMTNAYMGATIETTEEIKRQIKADIDEDIREMKINEIMNEFDMREATNRCIAMRKENPKLLLQKIFAYMLSVTGLIIHKTNTKNRIQS